MALNGTQIVHIRRATHHVYGTHGGGNRTWSAANWQLTSVLVSVSDRRPFTGDTVWNAADQRHRAVTESRVARVQYFPACTADSLSINGTVK